MVRLKIIEKNGDIYSLEDKNEKKYTFDLVFFDIEDKPQIGDYINMSAELLNTRYAGYSASYTFGNLENKYGRKDINLTDIDVIIFEKEGKNIFLKRLYG